MDKPFLSAYSRLLIKTCHKRGAFAMGGMAAFIPSKDAERNNQVLNKVKADKELEARNGHDGHVDCPSRPCRYGDGGL